MASSFSKPVLTVSQSRLVDQIAMEQFGMLGLVLMENAGRGAADWIAELAPKGAKIVILCGSGNNGGDGLVIARHLHSHAFDISIWMIGDRSKLTDDTASNLAILEKTSLQCRWLTAECDTKEMASLVDVAIEDIRQSAVTVDAMLGTGAKGELRGTFAQMVHAANRSQAIRVAIDVPTGLDAQTGHCSIETFRAHHTLTFVAPKVGMLESATVPFIGELRVLPIGIPPEVIDLVSASTPLGS